MRLLHWCFDHPIQLTLLGVLLGFFGGWSVWSVEVGIVLTLPVGLGLLVLSMAIEDTIHPGNTPLS